MFITENGRMSCDLTFPILKQITVRQCQQSRWANRKTLAKWGSIGILPAKPAFAPRLVGLENYLPRQSSTAHNTTAKLSLPAFHHSGNPVATPRNRKMALPSTVPPVLSTPESHIFEDPTPPSSTEQGPRYDDTQIREIFEIERTIRKLREGGYRRGALQFPDAMLRDAVRVFELLELECTRLGPPQRQTDSNQQIEVRAGELLETSINALSLSSAGAGGSKGASSGAADGERVRFTILADTSYGSCCVDEIAAEHVSADVVVHYGRSCLSPTARLPVIYVFTSHPLPLPSLIQSFESTFPEKGEKVLLMADVTYHAHVPAIKEALLDRGYTDIVAPEVIHEPESVVPNRRVEEGVRERLGEYSLFHVSEPPPALLLTLASRVKEMYIYPTALSRSESVVTPEALKTQTNMILRRRYALLTHLSTAPILGILINTLSVSHHLAALSTIKKLIEKAGKKSYTFVVGKVNAAKLANFSEIGGWVVVGCWESSLVDGEGFYRGVVTPFELGVALQGERRVWDGSWRGDFGAIAGTEIPAVEHAQVQGSDEIESQGRENGAGADADEGGRDAHGDDGDDSEEESEPPEFDLRTGRYISHSRPMRPSRQTSAPVPISTPAAAPGDATTETEASNVLTRRAKGDLATINGAVSPGAEYLRSQRTWTGLGSDFLEGEDAPEAGIEEGRGGVARGYRVGGEGERR
ncbi:uncharacterized protein L3040_005266 [Drepanopeziza brunnea f. sp. 'multigermtubi']|uniref:2-(3-amino-3-carboxypropyl)histidine synthase subunit 2 n=1 Tax=Marssonina brunnea f. sp. multigermtubi (strain MB_m1) TaxID=1072389 RepID=K1WKE6_MARBU|nr:uncharacterized protein MBM_09251 [Drepanopeziza brunnea f. sp. 'multigermtubi' MB_m1]EKD12682.1 hypothetical protein MBM_09251 [Drepanopeziza brunnea f. sp. 'multigermtubi' MB_m1]KAJ5041696.1 hypothetical protein L3040_005266 [Drepanopeziza brunnea f. sp. 'multigermtubi']